MAKRSMQFSTKRLMISQANSTMVVAVSIAAFLTAFSLVAARSLLVKRAYQSRVISAQEEARDQLQANIAAVDSLKASYDGFVSREENLIGGSRAGNGGQDGDNAKIVLDALPSAYDFPALVTSLEKILTDRNYEILELGGTDEEASRNVEGGDVQDSGSTIGSGTGVDTGATATAGDAVTMPFELSAEGDYNALIDLLAVFQRSIRPIFMQELIMRQENSASTVQLDVQGQSYYQPEKKLDIEYEVVQ